MDNLRKYVDCFFDQLEIFEDIERGHNYKSFIQQSVRDFLTSESKSTAFAVFQTFFDAYRISIPGQANPFIDLIDVLRNYEEQAAPLIDKQRDHYIHSVNVFLLGLSIYAQNNNIQSAFNDRNLNKTDYPFSYDTRHEEFFYRWGIASLFHDIGYPIEIIGKQLNKFMNFIIGIDSDQTNHVRLEFENLQELNTIKEVIPKRDFTKSFYDKNVSCGHVDLLTPLDLLALKLHLSLGVNLDQIIRILGDFENFMESSGFIDHGFFSALIVLKWYGFLIQTCGYKPDYFYYPVLDSASAILLHNFYRNVIMKPPFEHGSLSAMEHPIAYLLILCDEIQEWNRQAYGILDVGRVQADQISLVITDEHLDVTYITSYGNLPESFPIDKKSLIDQMLNTKQIFRSGIRFKCQSLDEQKMMIEKSKDTRSIIPRPLLENLERMAVAIHELYNQKQLERFPDRPLSYPSFADLPDSIKYSNLRQARSIVNKIDLIGWKIRPIEGEGNQVKFLPEEVVEILARIEHEDWVRERIENGWVFGKNKDVEKKITPYLVPYETLDETIKERDRDTIRNIPALLKMVGLAIHEK